MRINFRFRFWSRGHLRVVVLYRRSERYTLSPCARIPNLVMIGCGLPDLFQKKSHPESLQYQLHTGTEATGQRVHGTVCH